MDRADPLPLTDDEFAHVMDRLCPRGPFALAVSGGSDSVALLDLADAYAQPRNRKFAVLTVDHGLRPGSADDARFVAEAAKARGRPHALLTWSGEKPRANLEARAREARYALMCGWCAAHGIGVLMTAHSQDDQAETVLLRLARGSGVDGLAAMAERSVMGGVTLLRPLLDVPRARLRARAQARGLPWVEDPMNDDPQFARVKIRHARDTLSELGLTPARLAATARAMGRARSALEEDAARLLREAVTVAPEAACEIDIERLAATAPEIALRALAQVLMAVGGLIYRPRLERLERLYAVMRQDGLGGGRTLGGCRIVPLGVGRVQVLREAALIDPAPLVLAPGEEKLWDRRFKVSLTGGVAGEVRALGALGLKALEAAAQAPLTSCPALLRATLPGLWVNGRLVSAPHLGLAWAGQNTGAERFMARFEGLRDHNSVAEGEE